MKKEIEELKIDLKEKSIGMEDQQDEIKELKSEVALQKYVHESIQCSNCKI